MAGNALDSRSLCASAIASCRRRLRSRKIADTTGATLTGGALLTRALVLRRLLRRGLISPDEGTVGILLPPSAAAVVTNLALTLDRRVVVNLNYALTSELLNASIRQAGIRHVVTSRKVLERLPLEIEADLVILEDLRNSATRVDKLVSAAMAYAMPQSLLARTLGVHEHQASEPMAIMFTSGTTGEPRGAILTQDNIRFNVNAVEEVIRLESRDVVIGVLPFFHSFGYSITLWSVLALDVAAAYHHNPLDGQTVGRLSREQHGTILLATPTFLRNYIRRVRPEDFRTLEVVVTGAERLPAQVQEEFAHAFGVRPVEGYGTTETSPLIAANIPPSRATGKEESARDGTVGRPAPGVRVKLVHPDTGDDLPPGERGLLLVSGPNVMQGYIGGASAGNRGLRAGWYVTGDICTIDDDGFITIVGRQSRFAKIAGEMVPHAQVEDAITDVIGPDEEGRARVAVVSVPDAERGERLVAVHTPLDLAPAEVRQRLRQAGLPNLFIPDNESFIEIDELPMVGAGKLDLQRVLQIATTKLAEPSGSAPQPAS